MPPDCDLVFDVRFLPNPNYIPMFKQLTGKNPAVARYIRSFPQTDEFIGKVTELLTWLLPHYIREGKSYLTIGFGCTGGHHRSVMIAETVKKEPGERRISDESDSHGIWRNRFSRGLRHLARMRLFGASARRNLRLCGRAASL